MGDLTVNKKPRVLITEEIDPVGVTVLASRGFAIEERPDLSTEELVQVIDDFDGLIVRSHTQVTAEVIAASKGRLKVIGRAGVSVDNIDLEAATEAGIIVCNAPNSNITSAAEMAFALMLSCARNIPEANSSMHKGQWNPGAFKGCELYEKTLAIFGLGRVGSLVAQRAAAFGMKLIGYDHYCSTERAQTLGVELYESVDDIVPLADFITVHLPKTQETAGMFGPNQYAAMKDGVIIVNTARDGIFDESSLADFMATGKIRSVGFDVFENEPCATSPLHEFDNAILTPHIGAITDEAQRRAGIQIATYVAQALEGSMVPTAINITHLPPEVIDKFGTYLNASQMMGRILFQLQGDVPRSIDLTASGTLASVDTTMLLAGALKGIMAYKNIGSVTGSNAEALAQRHGIDTHLTSQINAYGYDSLLSITTDSASISCTLYGTDRPARIISLFGYSFDIEPAAQSLIFRYKDAPGRMGIIGTVLGEAGVNITTMQIGTKEGSDEAITFINIDGQVSEEVLERLWAELPELQNLWYIRL